MKIKYISLIGIFYLMAVSNLLAQSNINIIPQPQELIIGKGVFTINSQTEILYLAESKHEAIILQEFIQNGLGSKIVTVQSNKQHSGSIIFKQNSELEKESYELDVSKNGIQIIASTNTGWFYGIQSLKQLFPESFGSSLLEGTSINIPKVKIKDAPRFSWRAFMLDEARYFKGMKQVKMLLDEMARLKMNVFHWHLVDDQGWRIEIKKYPLLTEIGSTRASTQVGPLLWDSPIQSAESHSGFYTQNEIKEIVKYASERHITIVPEIEMPGHATAAIASYSWLGTTKKEIEVPIKFGVSEEVYDISDPKVYQFLTDVLDEVMDLFPSKVIHIGGDEVKYTHWKNSDTVQTYLKENKLATPAELQVFFTNRISKYLESKGRHMMGWNEIMGHQLHSYQESEDNIALGQELAKGTIIHFWKGDISLLIEAASNGYEIVNSLHSNTYLDYNYKTLPLSKAYAFDPIPDNLDPKYYDKVIGLGCQMWSEWIPTNGEMQFLVFPRIAAYAEVGWTKKENKNFDNFKLRLKSLQKIWEQRSIYYAPDSSVVNDEVKK
ncbi:beta-N-acetylhexosaminidase [Lutibacter flavus]|uniref:beta-N-acetylhexosaminidase n=1 Tax=Lutibacter flavus TaxID=691689 RepID=A0A238YUV3_9FLAO|nr:beta-N-acetylhexosaminidase [Lutibacter flavus]SNR74840.1 hexosaminidase [Lutibacter flavus]